MVLFIFLFYFDVSFQHNIVEIVNYIIDNFEVPLAQAKEAEENVDENLLSAAVDVVTENTSNSEW